MHILAFEYNTLIFHSTQSSKYAKEKNIINHYLGFVDHAGFNTVNVARFAKW